LTGLIPEGANSHTFEPRPSDAKLLGGANLIFLNGLHLEEPTRKLAVANLKRGAKIVELGPQTITPEEEIFDFSFPKEAGDPNPHLWMNPAYAKRYAEIVEQELSRADPTDAIYFQTNYRSLAARIDELDRAIVAATASVPPANRKLLTYHDSFAYFARRYGWDVIGAIQPADFAEPTPREVAALIDQVRSLHLPAIFGSEVFPSPVLAQIARETGAHYVDDLRDDNLPGKPGDRDHSYIGLMVADVVSMTGALGGDPQPLKRLDPANLAGTNATYRP
jgi:ABC-type Zn uptake system ZnuABC Zn-binding protein ZnuA